MTRIALGLGSNLGDRLAFLQSAVEALAHGAMLETASPVYETAPMYVVDQPPFFNAVLLGQTDKSPLELLKYLKQVEAHIGRKSGQRYGPREIDIDLVAYGSLKYRYGESGKTLLEVPHRLLAEREFVLRPLSDLDPEYALPGLGMASTLLRATEGQTGGVLQRTDARLSIPRL